MPWCNLLQMALWLLRWWPITTTTTTPHLTSFHFTFPLYIHIYIYATVFDISLDHRVQRDQYAQIASSSIERVLIQLNVVGEQLCVSLPHRRRVQLIIFKSARDVSNLRKPKAPCNNMSRNDFRDRFLPSSFEMEMPSSCILSAFLFLP